MLAHGILPVRACLVPHRDRLGLAPGGRMRGHVLGANGPASIRCDPSGPGCGRLALRSVAKATQPLPSPDRHRSPPVRFRSREEWATEEPTLLFGVWAACRRNESNHRPPVGDRDRASSSAAARTSGFSRFGTEGPLEVRIIRKSGRPGSVRGAQIHEESGAAEMRNRTASDNGTLGARRTRNATNEPNDPVRRVQNARNEATNGRFGERIPNSSNR